MNDSAFRSAANGLALALVFSTAAARAEIVQFSVPAGIAPNDDFAVKVRAPGGPWRELFEYAAQVDMRNVRIRGRGIVLEGREGVQVMHSKNVTIDDLIDETRGIENITFENLVINGREISWRMDKPAYYLVGDMGKICVGPHVAEIEFLSAGGARPPSEPAPGLPVVAPPAKR